MLCNQSHCDERVNADSPRIFLSLLLNINRLLTVNKTFIICIVMFLRRRFSKNLVYSPLNVSHSPWLGPHCLVACPKLIVVNLPSHASRTSWKRELISNETVQPNTDLTANTSTAIEPVFFRAKASATPCALQTHSNRARSLWRCSGAVQSRLEVQCCYVWLVSSQRVLSRRWGFIKYFQTIHKLLLWALLSRRLKHDSMLCLNLSHVFPQHQPHRCLTCRPASKWQRRVGRKTHDSSTCHWGTNTRYAPRLF